MDTRAAVLRTSTTLDEVAARNIPVDVPQLSAAKLDAENELGYQDMLSGNVIPAEAAFAQIRESYDL